MPNISAVPISDSRKIVRERTFRLVHSRPDFKDVLAQAVILISQLHEEHFTGQLAINYTQGSINNVSLVDSKKTGTTDGILE